MKPKNVLAMVNPMSSERINGIPLLELAVSRSDRKVPCTTSGHLGISRSVAKPSSVLACGKTDAARSKELDANVLKKLAILLIGNNLPVCKNQSDILSPIDRSLERDKYESFTDPTISNAFAFITKNLGNSISAPQIPNALCSRRPTTDQQFRVRLRHCAPTHLTNAFKTAFAPTPQDWRKM